MKYSCNGGPCSEIEWRNQFSFAVRMISWLWRWVLPVYQLCKGASMWIMFNNTLTIDAIYLRFGKYKHVYHGTIYNFLFYGYFWLLTYYFGQYSHPLKLGQNLQDAWKFTRHGSASCELQLSLDRDRSGVWQWCRGRYVVFWWLSLNM